MVFLYVVAAIVPVIIFFNSFRTLDKRVKDCRLRYALVSLCSIFYDTTLIIFIIMEYITRENSNYYVTIGPFILCFLSLISYRIGKNKERKIQADILAESAIDVMDLRRQNTPRTRL